MKFIITDYFSRIFKKRCKKTGIKEIIKSVNLYSKKFINLKFPFFKIKLKIGNKAYRLIVFSDDNLMKILFINIFDKKDKKFGENISWKISEKEILKFYEKNLEDIEKGNFEKYDENGNILKKV